MRQIKCDLCGRQIDKVRECYYSIEEISFNTPNVAYREIRFVSNDDVPDEPTDEKIGWSNWTTVDFCELCWNSEALKALRLVTDKER
jgi:hypothetical protein